MFQLKVVLDLVICDSHTIFLFVHYDKLFMKHNLLQNPGSIKQFTLSFYQTYIKINQRRKKLTLRYANN